jgi:hypothetical protein
MLYIKREEEYSPNTTPHTRRAFDTQLPLAREASVLGVHLEHGVVLLQSAKSWY